MKKIFIYIFSAIAFLGWIQRIQAQVIDVCADTDSIILHAGNYQYGTIEWETSYDSTHWTRIEGANDTIYKFLPTETKYYRTIAKFSECPPEYSEVCLVQMAPEPNAGGDRIVPGNSVVMMANLNPGETGSWAVLNGNGGSFTNANDPYSDFQGTDSTYTLIWTVSNACGTSSDTLNLQFRDNIYINPLVVVDTTDIILSDSTQIANGEYIIEFNTPVPQITDSTVLIGLAADGFLRKVLSYTAVGDTFTMQTVQASLEDITLHGAYDIAQVFNIDTTMTGFKSTNYNKLNHMPTRAELISNPMYKKGNYFYMVKNEPVYTYPGVSLKNTNTKSGSALIDLNFDKTILNTGNVNLELNGNYSFTPNLKADLDYSGLHLNNIKIGMYNGKIDRYYELALTASSSTSLLDQEFTLLSMNKDIVFVLGGVPVWVRTEFKIDGQVSVDISESINITHEYYKTSVYTAAIEYENGQWNYIYNESDYVQSNNSFSVTGDLTQTFDIGPNITFKIYGIVGPYFDARLTEELNLCAYNENWQANMNIGGELSVGVKAEILGATLFDVSKTWSQRFYNLQFPYNIEMISGNNQNYTSMASLAYPVKVKVMSNKGFSIAEALVHFSPQNGGNVSNNIVVTDANGYAQTTWTPGGSNSSNLQAYILDCDGNNINNSPIVFTSYEGSNNCIQSSLSVSISISGNNISPVAQMGTPPYTYSIDGNSYISTVPSITTTASSSYTFYVKDANDCIAMASYSAPSDACLNSNLSLSLFVSGNTIEASAAGGTPPYEYALDASSGSFASSNTFNNVSTGSHIVYVKEANGCIASANTYIYSSGGSGCTVTDIDGNTYSTVVIGNQEWIAENLKVTHYADGTALVDGTGAGNITGDYTTKYYFWYNDDSTANADTYGALYTWAAVMNGSASSDANPSGVQGVCPTGWHVPSDAEWTELTDYLTNNGYGYEGSGNDIGKSMATTFGWKADGTPGNVGNDQASNNSSGFTALPGGYRSSYGAPSLLGSFASFWSATELNSSVAWGRGLGYDRSEVYRDYYYKFRGFSARCLKD